MRATSITIGLVAGLLVCAWGAAAPGAVIIDNFESYMPHGAVIADSASSTSPRPWIRFGAATATNVTATTAAGEVIADAVTAKYGLNWGLGNNGNIRRKYSTAFDLGQYDDAEAEMKATGVAGSTLVKFAFTDGVTTWTSTVGQALTSTMTMLTFDINPLVMTRTSGSASFAAVLANTNGIGFRFENSTGSGSSNVFVDDFALTLVPEPTAAALLSVGMLAMSARRPRRREVC